MGFAGSLLSPAQTPPGCRVRALLPLGMRSAELALRGGVWRCTVYVLYDCTVYVMYELYTVQTRYRGGVTMRVLFAGTRVVS